jgi:hypothetical protein
MPMEEYASGVRPGPHNHSVPPIEFDQDSLARGRPGLRIGTLAFRSAWRTVSGLTWSSLPIEAQESPDAYRDTARSMWSGVSTRPRLDTRWRSRRAKTVVR